MAEISKDYLLAKRQEYDNAIQQLQGAREAINLLLAEFYPEPPMTIEQLKQVVGAAEIGEPERIDGHV